MPLSVLLRLFVGLWSAVLFFFFLGSVSGIFSLPSSFCLDSFRPLYWWVSFPSSFLCFSPCSAFLYCLLPFASPVLCHSSLFLHEVLCRFLPWFGFIPSGSLFPRPFVSPHLVPLGFVLPLLLPAFSFGLFFISLVRPLVLLVLPFSLSLACSFLVPLLISFSPLGVSCTFVRVFPRISHLSLLWVALSSLVFTFLSCCRYVILGFTPLLSRSFLPLFLVFFHLCFFSDCSGASDFLVAFL